MGDKRERLVACVPNFSEGKDATTIELLSEAVRKYEGEGVMLLDVDPDPAYNRVVITFAGPTDGVLLAAFESVKVAYHFIDMRHHTGQHPRIGAADVVPFVPVTASIDACVDMARRLAGEVAEELEVPVYLYGEAALTPERRDLAYVRKGEYEALEMKLKDGEFKPDFGPARFVPSFGACCIGARYPLLAYNITLDTEDVELAREVARRIRTSGYKGVRGKFDKLRSIGVRLEGEPCVQVSCDILDCRVTGLAEVFEEVEKLAAERGVEVVESEIVGFAPKEALVRAGRFYADSDMSERELVELAIAKLKLADFDPDEMVMEYRLGIG